VSFQTQVGWIVHCHARFGKFLEFMFSLTFWSALEHNFFQCCCTHRQCQTIPCFEVAKNGLPTCAQKKIFGCVQRRSVSIAVLVGVSVTENGAFSSIGKVKCWHAILNNGSVISFVTAKSHCSSSANFALFTFLCVDLNTLFWLVPACSTR